MEILKQISRMIYVLVPTARHVYMYLLNILYICTLKTITWLNHFYCRYIILKIICFRNYYKHNFIKEDILAKRRWKKKTKLSAYTRTEKKVYVITIINSHSVSASV